MGEWFDSAREIAQWVLIIALGVKAMLLDRRLRQLESTAVVSELRSWFETAPEGATHLIVCVDEMDWTIFPVYVQEGEDSRKRAAEENAKTLQRVKEVYRLDYSFDKQVVQHRAMTHELPLDGYDDHVLEAASALELDVIDPELLALQVDRLIRAERARRIANERARRAKEENAQYDARKKAARRAHNDSRGTEKNGEAPGPSPIVATKAREEVDPPGAPPASGASPFTTGES